MSLGWTSKFYNQQINPYTGSPWTQWPVVVVHFNRSMASLLAMQVAALTISGRWRHISLPGVIYVRCVYHIFSHVLWWIVRNDVLKPKFWICSKQRVFHPGFEEVSADSIGESYPVLSHPLLCGFNDFDCYMLKRSCCLLKYDLNALTSLWMYFDIDRDLLFQMILMVCFNPLPQQKTQVWLKQTCKWS